MSKRSSTSSPKPTYGLGGSPACTKLVTIKIKTTGFVNHLQQVKRGDCVQWKDMTGHSTTLVFIRWPFTEAWQSINVPANGFSNVYHVAQGIPSGKYDYVPNPQPSSGPPDPPAVIVGD